MTYLNFANHDQSNNKSESVITLIDLSPSMDENDYRPTRKAGAIMANKKLLDTKLKHNPKDKMGIIGFGGSAKLLHTPAIIGKHRNSLLRALDDPQGSYGTNFTAALNLAQRSFFNSPVGLNNNSILNVLSQLFIEPESSKPKVPKEPNTLNRIIMLTDGEHNGEGCPVSTANSLKNSGVIIDCIGIGGSPADVDEKLLKQIASVNPDGSIRYCFIGDKQQLVQKYKTLAHHIQAL